MVEVAGVTLGPGLLDGDAIKTALLSLLQSVPRELSPVQKKQRVSPPTMPSKPHELIKLCCLRRWCADLAMCS